MFEDLEHALGHVGVACSGHVHPVVGPHAPVVVLAEAPVVYQQRAVVSGDPADQFVVDCGPAAHGAEHLGPPGVEAGEHHHGGAGGSQLADGVVVLDQQFVDVDRGRRMSLAPA